MSTRVVERVDDWTERPFGGGYGELQDLADAAFSGVVRAGGAELFMTRGAVVGIRRGSIEDFEDGSGTVYEAPTDALALLALMQARSDEVRAKYYSEDTGLDEVNQTLEGGGFTGFVELSENVLSGDYYLVYHQGHSMSVAYVGNSGTLLTDDEAFERANDEVGIYEVRPVDIDPVEIPEPPEPEPEPEPAAETDDTETDDTDDADDADVADGHAVSVNEETQPAETAATDTDGEDPDGAVAESEPLAEPDPLAGHTPPDEHSADANAVRDPDSHDTDDDPEPATPEPVAETADAGTERKEETTVSPPVEPEVTDAEAPDNGVEPPRSEPTPPEPSPSSPADEEPETNGGATGADRNRASGSTAAQTEQVSPDAPKAAEANPAQGDVPPTPTPPQGTEAAASDANGTISTTDTPSSLETRAIPSLDPERTSTRSQTSATEPRRDAPGRTDETEASVSDTSPTPDRGGNAVTQPERDESERGSEATDETTAERTGQQAASRSDPEEIEESGTTEREPETARETESEPDSERIEELQALLTEREKEISRLEADLQGAESERESLRRELQEVREERDDLAAQVETLESELERLEEELGAATDAQQRMTPQEALSGTDVFVRYRSKGDATLEDAHQSGAVKSDVSENLRLEKHTQFDADISAVGGREYGEFLEDTVSHKFVRWVVEDLIFEIQGTGHTETLSELYDALPKINRVELNGAVNVTYTEDGQETQGTETFDVVFRERMGDPLLVANINESRQGASEAMMEGLITAAERVGQTSDQFASAFLVTESFFEPEALETVAEATRGGLLSRDKRKSFVNLSRKRGYHLCLVEARNQNFHLEVPEL